MYVLNSLIPNCVILYMNSKPCTMMYTLKFGRIATNCKTRTICMFFVDGKNRISSGKTCKKKVLLIILG